MKLTSSSHSIVPKSFFQSTDVVGLSEELLGKLVVSKIDGELTSGYIVETEAYKAPEDKASHAFNMKRSPKNEHMYRIGGSIYVYICYGIHNMLNLSTGPEGLPHAILIRAIEPVDGIEIMMRRRNMRTVRRNLTGGPGLVCQALGIDKSHSGKPIYEKRNLITLHDVGIEVKEDDIIRSPRVGLTTAEEWTDIPWRFRIKNNKWTSPAK